MKPVADDNGLSSFLKMLKNQADTASRDRDMEKDILGTAADADCHSSMILSHWDKLTNIINTVEIPVDLDGKSLDLAVVVAVARYVTAIKKRSIYLL